MIVRRSVRRGGALQRLAADVPAGERALDDAGVGLLGELGVEELPDLAMVMTLEDLVVDSTIPMPNAKTWVDTSGREQRMVRVMRAFALVVMATGTVVVASSVGTSQTTGCEGRAWITNTVDDTVSVFDTATNTPITGSPFPTGDAPQGVAITPDGTRAWITNAGDDTVSVFDTATNTQITGSPFPTGDVPAGVAICPAATPPTPPTPPSSTPVVAITPKFAG